MFDLDIFVKFLVISFLGYCEVIANPTNSDITDIVFNNGGNNNIIAAYGDFNSDEITDVFTLSDNHHIIDIWLGSDTENPLLQISPVLRCNHSDLTITNIVPGDFDGDAFMDVLFTAKLENDLLGVYVNWGGSNYINCTPTKSQPIIKTKGEPIALDFKDDMIIDLFGVDEDNNRRLWLFRKGRSGIDTTLLLNTTENKSFSPISIPHSNAILDLNEDHLADLFIKTTDDFEVWYGKVIGDNNEERTYEFDHRIQLPTGSYKKHVGQATFLDLELKGELNLLVPFCFDEKCQNSTILTTNGKKLSVNLNVNFMDTEGKLWGFLPPNDKDFYRQTITLREGDFNMDGYPDLLATLTKDGGKTIKTFLLQNVENKKPSSIEYKRTFEVLWTALLPNKNDTIMGSFYDFYQDGILDVILLQKKNDNIMPLAFRNTLDYDANFVKVIVLTGLSNETKPATRTPLGRKKRTYGTNLPGPSIVYSTTTQEGEPKKGAATQLPQSAYLQLHLPYTIFGLGRTPNFVDEVVVGLSKHSRKFEQLIPNSQILVIPNPPNDPSSWKAQLFVTPSKIIIKSVFALGGICLVILLIILVLHLKERREDRMEKLLSAHQFHFDAM